ncbi:hypothetical protein ACI65C_011994 [Semiaphis heraclei]
MTTWNEERNASQIVDDGCRVVARVVPCACYGSRRYRNGRDGIGDRSSDGSTGSTPRQRSEDYRLHVVCRGREGHNGTTLPASREQLSGVGPLVVCAVRKPD